MLFLDNKNSLMKPIYYYSIGCILGAIAFNIDHYTFRLMLQIAGVACIILGVYTYFRK